MQVVCQVDIRYQDHTKVLASFTCCLDVDQSLIFEKSLSVRSCRKQWGGIEMRVRGNKK